MTPGETLEHFEGRRDAIIGQIREIVEIESPSHNAERSREVVDWIENAYGDRA